MNNNSKSSQNHSKNGQSPNAGKPNQEDSYKAYTTEPLDTARLGEEENRNFDRNSSQNKNKQKPFGSNPSNKQEDFYKYAATNKEQLAAYGLLILGLFIMLFFNPLLGGLILGGVAGYYFAPEIVYFLRQLTRVGSGKDQVRYIILAALLIGFIFAAPGIFLGAVIVAIFTQVLANQG